jgi:hypothetical protein
LKTAEIRNEEWIGCLKVTFLIKLKQRNHSYAGPGKLVLFWLVAVNFLLFGKLVYFTIQCDFVARSMSIPFWFGLFCWGLVQEPSPK